MYLFDFVTSFDDEFTLCVCDKFGNELFRGSLAYFLDNMPANLSKKVVCSFRCIAKASFVMVIV